MSLIILSLLPINGRAATLAENKALCADQKGPSAIAACTSLIAAEGLSRHNLAAAYINRGVLASDIGDLDNAIADLTQAILIDPSYELARVNRGRMYQRKDDLERAEADYIAALKLDPMDTDAGVYLFRIHSRMHAPEHKPSASDATLSAQAGQAVRAGLDAETKGRHDEAIAAFTRALGDDPMLADAFAWRGFAKGNKGGWEAAIADGLASVRLAPKNAKFSYLLGFSLMAAKNYDRAIVSFKRAAQLAPKQSDYVYMIGQAEEEKGDLQAAMADYQRALTIKPDHKGAKAAFDRLATKVSAGSELCLADKDMTSDKRVAACTELIDQNRFPDNAGRATAYFRRGQAHAAGGDKNAALADFSKAITFDPADPVYFDRRGDLYAADDRWEDAIADFKEAERLGQAGKYASYFAGKRKIAQDRQAEFAKRQKDPEIYACVHGGTPLLKISVDQKLKACDAVLSRVGLPADARAEALFARATVYGRKRQLQQALEDISSAIALKSDAANYFAGRGEVYLMMNERQKAVADFESALAIDPKNKNAARRLAALKSGSASGTQRTASPPQPSPSGIPAVRKEAKGPASTQHASPSPGEKGGAGVMRASSCQEVDGKPDGTPTPARAAQIKDAEVSYKQMLDAYARQDWQEVVRAADAMLAVNWRICESYQKQGDAFVHLGKFDRAIEDYQNVLRDTPANETVRAALENARKAAEDAKAAAATAARGVAESRVADLRKQMADGETKGDWQHVVGAATSLLEIDTDSARTLWSDAWEKRGDAYMRLAQPDNATKDYKTAAASMSLSPADRARLDAKLNAAEKAIPAQRLAALSKRIEAVPQDAVALDARAHFYQDQKDWRKALADYDAVINLHDRDAPDSPAKWQGLTLSDVYIGRGDVLMALRLFDRAERDYLKALDYEKELKVDWRSSKAYGGLTEANTERVRTLERPLKQLCAGDACAAIDASRDSQRACLSVANKGPATVELTITTDRDSRHVVLRKGGYTGGFVGLPFMAGVYDCMRGVVQRMEARIDLCLTPDRDLPADFVGPHSLDDRITDCGRVIKAFDSLYRAQGEFNDIAAAYLARGHDYETKGDLALAVADYSMANDEGNLSLVGLTRRGQVYLKLHKPQLAAIDFHFAAEMDSHNAELKKLDEQYQKSLGLKTPAAVYRQMEAELYTPKLATALKSGFVPTLGLNYGSGSDLRDVRTDAIRFNPNSLVAWNNLGVLDLALGRTQDAIDEFGRALAIKPRQGLPPDGYIFQHWDEIDAGIHYNLGVAYEQAGGAGKAAAEYKLAAKYRADDLIRAAWFRTDPDAAKR